MKTSTNRMFRQHDVAPEGVYSPLFRQLTREWVDLHTRTSTTATVRRWGRAESALEGFARPGDIVDAIDAAGNERANELLLALIRQFQAGQQLAGRTVLQAMLPKLARTSRHVRSSETNWGDQEDQRHITIADFWEVMSNYPVARRTSRGAANLALDTLNRVAATPRPEEPLPVSPEPADYRADRGDRDQLNTRSSGSDLELNDDLDLLQVIAWGMNAGAITRDEAQLLATSYVPNAAGSGFAATAERLALSEATVRQRASRATRKLAEAVRLEMSAPADLLTPHPALAA